MSFVYVVRGTLCMGLMRASCHLDRPSNVEIGVGYEIIFVVIF